MESSIKGKTALVTGAGAGIGRALAIKLVELGANVIAVSQTQSRLDSLAAELGGASAKLTLVCVNLADWKQTEAKLAELCSKVDLLVNNAGCSSDQPVDGVTEPELSRVLDTNLKAPMLLTKLVAKGMKARKYGSIVNVSSVAGISALDDHLSYAASKAGLDMATRVSAKELGPYNVRVNSVNPTVVWTELSRAFWSEPTRQRTMMSKIPMNRFAEVHDVVHAIVYLLSDAAGMVNGITLPIDGGFTAS